MQIRVILISKWWCVQQRAGALLELLQVGTPCLTVHLQYVFCLVLRLHVRFLGNGAHKCVWGLGGCSLVGGKMLDEAVNY
jgi:hypothetical protein